MKDFDLNSEAKIDFCTLPTPIIPMKRLSKHLGKNKIFIKRDDLTGLAFGGNKNRKLEYLLADAINKGANVIITEGAVTSNHCLQTAASSCHLGLECVLVLSDSYIGDSLNGNFLLDHILDVDIRRVKTSEDRKPMMNQVADKLKEQGKKPYIIPTGGSNVIGILGYVNSIKEIAKQSEQMKIKFDYFVHATGSAGTQAGCIAGKKLFYPDIEIIGINIGDGKEEIIEAIQQIIDEFEQKNSFNLNIEKSDIIIMDGYFGEGYGIPSKELIKTMKLVAKLEGIFLDPVYNGKAMIGLINLIKKNHFKENSNILFLHSGGGPAIFSYNKYFNKK
ncbi:MAG: D-cysteine desulfhydrase family protein [Asgard group archaeon]|nr:D-cysteine desulfhydrase family protein [Asgard group archaeon]